MRRRPVAELVAGIGRTVPGEVAEVKRPGPLGSACPKCKAAIGRLCRTPGGSERAAHTARVSHTDPAANEAEAERIKAVAARHLAREQSDIHEETR